MFVKDFINIINTKEIDEQIPLLNALIVEYVDKAPYMDLLIHQEIGIHLIQMEHYKEGLYHLEKTLDYVEDYGLFDNTSIDFSILFSNLAIGYYKTKDFESAAHLLLQNTGSSDFLSDVKTIEDFNETLRTIETRAIRETSIRQRRIIFFISALGLLLMLSLVIIFIELQKIMSLKNNIEEQAIKDSLTGLYNRKKIIELYEKNKSIISAIALLDIDDFKLINDTHGHLIGDEVIKKISSTLLSVVKEDAYVGRYGGEEFLILIKSESSIELCNSIKLAIESNIWSFSSDKITVSIGLLIGPATSFDLQFKRADELLYKAKRLGKNQVHHQKINFF